MSVDGRGKIITRNIVASKCIGQNELLRKYGLVELDYDNVMGRLSKLEDDSPTRYRSRLNGMEGNFTDSYLALFTYLL